MALSGTLDTFALPDVLRLLASTNKTGRLRVTGDRGSGSVWVDGGEVVATELASAMSQDPSHEEVVFGLLRFAAGSFTFEVDATAPNADTGLALEPVLGAAENMLIEWKAIEAVIPSLDVWVGLQPELEGPDVMVDSTRWRGIAAIGSGTQVGAVAEALSLNEIDSCRLVKELIELKLVDFVDEPVGAPVATSFEPEPEPFAIEDEPPTTDEVGSDDGADIDTVEDDTIDGDLVDGDLVDGDLVDGDTAEDEIDDLAPSDTGVVPSLAALGSTEESLDPLLPAGDPLDDLARDDADDEMVDIFAAGGDDLDADEDLDPAEMARQLANLSPKAAKAVAAAAKATTEEERDAALAAVEAEDDSVNRGLLLRFLGSVDS